MSLDGGRLLLGIGKAMYLHWKSHWKIYWRNYKQIKLVYFVLTMLEINGIGTYKYSE